MEVVEDSRDAVTRTLDKLTWRQRIASVGIGFAALALTAFLAMGANADPGEVNPEDTTTTTYDNTCDTVISPECTPGSTEPPKGPTTTEATTTTTEATTTTTEATTTTTAPSTTTTVTSTIPPTTLPPVITVPPERPEQPATPTH
ncbi:hypothetical protein KDA00_04475 [Candidatus Saccharibacteria bacterium]|nr:hypothetical protein [Candidatus Saccharibacteria bacterium]